MTFDQVNPPSVVPRRTDEPPLLVLPTCSGTASDPRPQHSLSVGHERPVRPGSGTLAGKGSGAQVSPPLLVDATSLIMLWPPGLQVKLLVVDCAASAAARDSDCEMDWTAGLCTVVVGVVVVPVIPDWDFGIDAHCGEFATVIAMVPVTEQ